MSKNDTSRMIEAVATGGGSEVLGMVLEMQARDRDFTFNAIVEGKDIEIERLTRQRDQAWRRIEQMESRLAWLAGHDFDEDLR